MYVWLYVCVAWLLWRWKQHQLGIYVGLQWLYTTNLHTIFALLYFKNFFLNSFVVFCFIRFCKILLNFYFFIVSLINFALHFLVFDILCIYISFAIAVPSVVATIVAMKHKYVYIHTYISTNIYQASFLVLAQFCLVAELPNFSLHSICIYSFSFYVHCAREGLHVKNHRATEQSNIRVKQVSSKTNNNLSKKRFLKMLPKLGENYLCAQQLHFTPSGRECRTSVRGREESRKCVKLS